MATAAASPIDRSPLATPAPGRAGHATALGRAWDVVTRLMNVAWVGTLLLLQIAGLFHLAAAAPEGEIALVASGMAARIASIMFLCVFAVGVVVRAPRVGSAQGLVPRIMALGGSFIPTFVFLLPRGPESLVLNLLSSLLCAVGFGLAAWGFAHLNRSASIMPEARSLVTSGPYRYIRHPVYAFEAIGVAGMFLVFDPMLALMLYILQCLCQLQRMRYEEGVLTASFPAYAAYAARTPRLIPGVL